MLTERWPRHLPIGGTSLSARALHIGIEFARVVNAVQLCRITAYPRMDVFQIR